MKIFKRNQIIILVMSLMLVTAGYLSFTANDNINKTAEVVAELGDATLVNSNSIEESKEENKENLVIEPENDIVLETANVIERTNDDYFINSKLDRNSMYSEMLETYQSIYNNTTSTAEQKKDALEKIAKINSTKNAIMIAENLIIAKGFKNVLIFVNENSISVILDEEELKQEQIAQIQNIVSRELQAEDSIIHISTK